MNIAWRTREAPLPANAAIARGAAARALAERLDALSDEALKAIRGAAGNDLIVIAGDQLPWIDGIEYLGRDDQLLLPTTLSPTVPVPLLARAIAFRHPDLPPPVAIVTAPDLLVSLAALAPIERTTLRLWMERGR